MTFFEILTLPLRMIWHALFWTFDRATWQYDLMVIAILGFVWLTPPGWLNDCLLYTSPSPRDRG